MLINAKHLPTKMSEHHIRSLRDFLGKRISQRSVHQPEWMLEWYDVLGGALDDRFKPLDRNKC